MKVVKRDGRKAVFEKDKIKNAILSWHASPDIMP